MDTLPLPPTKKSPIEDVDAAANKLRADAFSLLTETLPDRSELLRLGSFRSINLDELEQKLKKLFRRFADYDRDLFQILPPLDSSSRSFANNTPDVFLAKRQVILDILQFTINTLNNHRVRERTNIALFVALIPTVIATIVLTNLIVRIFRSFL